MNWEALLVPAVALVFGAGQTAFLIKQSRRDVTGIGTKLNGEALKAARRHHNMSLSLMLLAPDDIEVKQQLVSLLKED